MEQVKRAVNPGADPAFRKKRKTHMISTILLILLVLMLLGTIPVWPHSRAWGYYPSGGLGLILLLLLLLVLFGRI